MELSKQSIFQKKEALKPVSMGDELAMLNPESGEYFVLNSVGKEIWDLIDGEKTVDVIIESILALFEISKEKCTESVINYIEKLSEDKLIEMVV